MFGHVEENCEFDGTDLNGILGYKLSAKQTINLETLWNKAFDNWKLKVIEYRGAGSKERTVATESSFSIQSSSSEKCLPRGCTLGTDPANYV